MLYLYVIYEAVIHHFINQIYILFVFEVFTTNVVKDNTTSYKDPSTIQFL